MLPNALGVAGAWGELRKGAKKGRHKRVGDAAVWARGESNVAVAWASRAQRPCCRLLPACQAGGSSCPASRQQLCCQPSSVYQSSSSRLFFFFWLVKPEITLQRRGKRWVRTGHQGAASVPAGLQRSEHRRQQIKLASVHAANERQRHQPGTCVG